MNARMQALRSEIEELETAAEMELNRKRAELARLEAMPDFGELVDGSVVGLTVTYGRSRPYTVIAYKTRSEWFLTGAKSPNGIDSDELASWLSTQGRRLGSAVVLAEFGVMPLSTIDLGALFGALGG